MVQEISDLINKVYTSNLLLKQAEIERLQSQMNPHFLTNTLATISTSALLNNDQEVHEMITCLNDLVTANLYNSKAGNHFVPIQEELDYVRKYLTIQQFRFQDKLRYHIDIENEALLDCFLPRLSIEPIVENAVIHGIQSKNTDDPGCINICLFDEGDDLLFIVADNGKGFEVKKLLQTDNNPSHGHNIGILNTHHRIQLLFGEPYGLEFESTLGVGTLVTMRIPRITKANLSSYVQTTQED